MASTRGNASDNAVSASTTASERRAHSRVSVKVNAELRAGDKSLSAECISMSLGGAALQSERPPVNIGSIVKVKVKLGDRDVEARAQVVRVQGGTVGLRFLELDQGSLLAILQAVSKNPREP
jgi:hypothetical protein